MFDNYYSGIVDSDRLKESTIIPERSENEIMRFEIDEVLAEVEEEIENNETYLKSKQHSFSEQLAYGFPAVTTMGSVASHYAAQSRLYAKLQVAGKNFLRFSYGVSRRNFDDVLLTPWSNKYTFGSKSFKIPVFKALGFGVNIYSAWGAFEQAGKSSSKTEFVYYTGKGLVNLAATYPPLWWTGMAVDALEYSAIKVYENRRQILHSYENFKLKPIDYTPNIEETKNNGIPNPMIGP